MSVAVPLLLRQPVAPRVGLLGLLALGLSVRLVVIVATPHYALYGDPADYDRIARFLVSQGEYPPSIFAAPGSGAALRPPGYPYLLAGVYEVFGSHLVVARILGAVLGTSSVGLTWGIVRRLWDPRTAAWAGGIVAVLPTLVWLSGGLVAEALFVPLLLGAVYATIRHRETPTGSSWVAVAGVLLGLAVLTRTNGIVLILPLLFAAWAPRRRALDPAVFLVACVITLTPWTIRNAVVFDAFLPLGTQSGFTVAGNYNAVSAGPGEKRGAWMVPMDVPELQPLLLQPGTTEATVDRRLRRSAFTFAKEHPGYVAESTAIHGLQLFQLWPRIQLVSGLSFREMGMPRWTWYPATLAFLLALVAAGLGLVRVARGLVPRGPLWFWAIPVLVVVTVAPLLGPPRYRIPADPFLAILAAIAIVALQDRYRGSRARDDRPQQPSA